MLDMIAKKVYSCLGPKSNLQLDDDSAIKKHISNVVRPRLSSYLPYLAEEDGIFFNKNSVGFVFEALPLIGSNEKIEQKLNSLFKNELPLGADIQFLLIASSKINHLLSSWANPRQQQGGLFRELATRRSNFFRKLGSVDADNASYCARDYKIIISVSFDNGEAKKSKLQKLRTCKKKIYAHLTNIGFLLTEYKAENLLKIVHELLNPTSKLDLPNVKYNPYDNLSYQMVDFDTEMELGSDELTWNGGKYKTRVYGVSRYPDEWVLSEMDRFVGDFFEADNQVTSSFMLHYGVHIVDEKTLKGRILAKCSNVEKQANSPIAKWIPSLKREAAEWGYVRAQFEKGERLVRSQFNVILFCKENLIESEESKIKGVFESQGWEIKQERYIMLLSFLSCLPMFWGEGASFDQKNFKKIKTTLSHEPVNLLPVQAEWHGSSKQGVLMLGRRGQVFTWCPFANRSGNFNVAVAGKSGSGKSVFMQDLVMSNLGVGGRSFVLDVGRSFEKLVKMLGGAYLEFKLESDICVNPFSAVGGDKGDNMLFMLKPIISLMAAPIKNTDDLENSLIEKAIKTVWDKKNNKATITNVADCLLKMKEVQAQDLGKRLYPYTSAGDYGRFFEGVANVDLSADLVVLELEELKERKDLQSVMVQIMILQVTNQIYMGDRKRPAQLVLDESWDMLRSKQSAEFIETAARRMRKYNGSLITGTQSVNDYYASPGAQAAFDNSDWLVLLEQKASSIEQLKKSGRIGEMTPYMEKVLKSIHTQKGKYAEAFIYGPDGYVVGRLFLDKYSQLLYTTDASEFSIIQELVDKGVPLKDALARLADA